MARVLALVPDLLFGSRIQGALTAAGHEVELITDERRLRDRLKDRPPAPTVLLVAHRFGHAASAETVHGTLALLDDAGIEGELALRETRSGRVEIMPGWGRPESAREEFRRLRAQ